MIVFIEAHSNVGTDLSHNTAYKCEVYVCCSSFWLANLEWNGHAIAWHGDASICKVFFMLLPFFKCPLTLGLTLLYFHHGSPVAMRVSYFVQTLKHTYKYLIFNIVRS